MESSDRLVTPICVYHLTLSGNVASLTEVQSCTLDDGAAAPSRRTTPRIHWRSPPRACLSVRPPPSTIRGCHIDATRATFAGRAELSAPTRSLGGAFVANRRRILESPGIGALWSTGVDVRCWVAPPWRTTAMSSFSIPRPRR